MSSINNCKPTKDTYKVHVPNNIGSINACSPIETPQLNEDLTDTDIKIGYVCDGASYHRVVDCSFFADVPTQLLRWFVDKNGNKKLQQCYHVFKSNGCDYKVIWKDIEIVYEE
jgi:hypothetical protein